MADGNDQIEPKADEVEPEVAVVDKWDSVIPFNHLHMLEALQMSRPKMANQGSTSTCSFFATTTAIEVAAKNANLNYEFSVQHLIDNAPMLNEKKLVSSPGLLLKYVQDYGICKESDHRDFDTEGSRKKTKCKKNNLFKIGGYEMVEDDEYNMVQTLMKGPIIALIAASKEFRDWRDEKADGRVFVQREPLTEEEKKPERQHAVVVMAYDTKVQDGIKTRFVTIQNSWGTGWGKDGYGDIGIYPRNEYNRLFPLFRPIIYLERRKMPRELRSPICVIMGHMGKSELMDCLQEGEAGGITQQIGAVYIHADNLMERIREGATLKIPGLLVIDSPDHESFTNLRFEDSGLCDIAVLVVDIMDGLDQRTIDSLKLLKLTSTEFIVALYKIDHIRGWKACKNCPINKAMKKQSKGVRDEFDVRLSKIISQLKEHDIKAKLYYKNNDRGETCDIVPTSTISGEGIPDLLHRLVECTQKTMVQKLIFRDEIECTVLDVKFIQGLGATIDVVLVNGELHEGDQIVVCGLKGPIVTTIQALLTPNPPMKGTYLKHTKIKGAQCIKINAQGLEHVILGTELYGVGPNRNLEVAKKSATNGMRIVKKLIDWSGAGGVYIQTSSFGFLEAMLVFLTSPAVTIPVSGMGIGPVHLKAVKKASKQNGDKKEYATILALNVQVSQKARELADVLGVKIIAADNIQDLFHQFKAYIDNIKEEEKKSRVATEHETVLPCIIKILPNYVYKKKNRNVLQVKIFKGTAKVGTPICVPTRDFIDIGTISSIELNHKPVDIAKKGDFVAIKIVGSTLEEQQKKFGWHYNVEDDLVSRISSESIDTLEKYYRGVLPVEDWDLVAELKNIFNLE